MPGEEIEPREAAKAPYKINQYSIRGKLKEDLLFCPGMHACSCRANRYEYAEYFFLSGSDTGVLQAPGPLSDLNRVKSPPASCTMASAQPSKQTTPPAHLTLPHIIVIERGWRGEETENFLHPDWTPALVSILIPSPSHRADCHAESPDVVDFLYPVSS